MDDVLRCLAVSLVKHCSDVHNLSGFIHIVKHPIVTDSQFPDGKPILKARDRRIKTFSVPRRDRWLIQELDLNLIHNPAPVENTNSF
jgi:hypothetical protein